MATPTPEEQARIDEARATVGELPEGVELDFVVLDDDEVVERIHDGEAAVFLTPTGFGWFKPSGLLPLLPAAELDGPSWLERAVAEDRVSCRVYGIGDRIEDVETPLFASFRLQVRIPGRINPQETPIIVWLDKAPEEWTARAMRRFCIRWPKNPAGPWMATGPITQRPAGVVVDTANLGRNDPCPCGSGKKYKRCHGA